MKIKCPKQIRDVLIKIYILFARFLLVIVIILSRFVFTQLFLLEEFQFFEPDLLRINLRLNGVAVVCLLKTRVPNRIETEILILCRRLNAFYDSIIAFNFIKVKLMISTVGVW